MARKLASVQRIVNIEPIPDADKIEKAIVLGWECVIQKDQFKIGDLVVYIETDSVLPEKPEFEFMRPRGFRVRAIKLRKQISMGLVFPLSILPEKKFGKYKEDDDLTELLGITKYLTPTEKEEERKAQISRNRVSKFLKRYKWYRNLFPKRKEKWPKFIRKTDEPRIQLFPRICVDEKDAIFYDSEKLDGCSATYGLLKQKRWLFNKNLFFVCSRNVYLNKETKNNHYWEIANKYNVKKVLENIIGTNQFVILQGEILGPGIQDNKYGLTERVFFAFNLIYPPYTYISPEGAESILLKNGIPHVPIISVTGKMPETIPLCVEMAKGKSIVGNIPREGIVRRNYERNLSFKVMNPDFLLKYGL